MEPNTDVTIIYPKICPVCALAEGTKRVHPVLVFEHEERCGKCGGSLGASHSVTSSLLRVHSPAIRSVLRSLLQHGVFEIEPSPSSHNPIRLTKQDAHSGSLITCHINHSLVGAGHVDTNNRPYERSFIAGALPPCVATACDLLSQLKIKDRHLSFEAADVRCERKTIRFTWQMRSSQIVTGIPAHEHIRIEIAWTEFAGANNLPTPEQTEQPTSPSAYEQELLIAADLAAMRLEAYRALGSNAEHKSIQLYTPIPSQNGYRRHPAAIEQLCAEVEAKGWSFWFTGRTVATSPYMVFEKKRAG